MLTRDLRPGDIALKGDISMRHVKLRVGPYDNKGLMAQNYHRTGISMSEGFLRSCQRKIHRKDLRVKTTSGALAQACGIFHLPNCRIAE